MLGLLLRPFTTQGQWEAAHLRLEPILLARLGSLTATRRSGAVSGVSWTCPQQLFWRQVLAIEKLSHRADTHQLGRLLQMRGERGSGRA